MIRQETNTRGGSGLGGKVICLLPRDQVHAFNTSMMALNAKLCTAAGQLQQKQSELRESARSRLGTLFDSDDYPEDMQLEYHLDWELVAVDVPVFLRELSESLWQKERARVEMRFEIASRLIQDGLISRFKELLAQLTAWLSKQASVVYTPVPPSIIARFRKFLVEADSRRRFCTPAFGEAIEQLQLVVERASSDDAWIIASWRPALRSTIASIDRQLEMTADGSC